ncbi:hypothetical protein SMSP2_01553 [Limihaloglobus sulfuriphilus]|uniref:Uncharacterized protein n=1 Tax=Limihaloglobus sulfuriphilus TaxID=1851148 RepID=A0A1Q2MFV7_9BACT|nr:hypothetical protein [Limihaloglobus sulfuriphilus]AQQ71187.1 hypothetical protein SMSP2_01553 [Limihaloglobus sulfuriphilus]
MKNIINGKVYDTETAELICSYKYGYEGDFRYVYEALYKSYNGQFFIEYKGGAMSKYSEITGPNEAFGGSGIRLIDEDEARDFIESNGSTEDYVKAFGEPEEG